MPDWQTMSERVSTLKALIIGGLGTILFGGLMVSVLVINPRKEVHQDELTVIEGVISEAGDTQRLKGHVSLQIWLKGRAIPFRCHDGPYPGYFDRDGLHLVKPGETAKISVMTVFLSEPSRDRYEGRDFYPFVSLEVGGRSLLTLDGYNAWLRSDNEVANWLLPLLFGLCAMLFIAGLRARERGDKYLPRWGF